MRKSTKRMNAIRKKIDINKQYDIDQAIFLLKELSTTKFIESVDIAVNLGIDSHKSEQIIRGTTLLPHGTGRSVRIAVFTKNTDIESIKEVGAELVGMEDLAEKIKKKEVDFDIVISSPDAMNVVSQLSQILGPRGLMPNPKAGTVTTNIIEAIKSIKSGQIRYRSDRNGIVHTTIGRVNFDVSKLRENLKVFLIALKKAKPIHMKCEYIRKISISTTMGIGITIDKASLGITIC